MTKKMDTSNKKSKKLVLHWFRKGLRLHDNPALRAALENANTYRCVYILDPWFAGVSQVGINKWLFLLQCLEDLDLSLRKLNSRLFVVQGQPAEVFPRLFKEWNISLLSFEEDPEPFGKTRDAAITALAKEVGVDVIIKSSHTLYDLQLIIAVNNGIPPLTYKRFQSVLSQMSLPPKPEERITLETIGDAKTPVATDHDDKYSVPTLEELGFDTSALKSKAFRGGETEALQRLHRHLERKAWVASFEKPKMTSESLFPTQTTLGPYLRFGCISPRLFYWKLHELYKKIKKCSNPPLSLHGQLLWREFFYTAATNNPNFDQMEGNPICVQIPWDKNPDALAKWAEIFDELLLDADWSVNAGMWLWLSCSSFFQQFLNCYCPVGFGKQADPTGDFIRHYLPVLKGFPPQYIYEPWNAPESIQKAARCIVGKDYPVPMVNHADASKLCMDRMKQVYQTLLKRQSRVQMPKQIVYNSDQDIHLDDKHTSGNHPSKADVIKRDIENALMGSRSHTSDSDSDGHFSVKA